MLNYSVPLDDTSPTPDDLQSLANKLKVLAEPKRLLILDLIMRGVQCNCELGDFLNMAPNLISHHLRLLKEAGLVDVERDAQDARWVYYSINQAALNELRDAFDNFFDPQRIKPRRDVCGPQSVLIQKKDISVV